MRHQFVLTCIILLAAGCGDMRSEAPAFVSDPAPQGEAMKIRFERSGGFAGLMTNVAIDAASLPEAERQAFMEHVSKAEFFTLPPRIADSSNAGADRYNYRITIESNGRAHTVECTDGSAPASLVPLIDWLNANARRAPRDPASNP